MMFLWGLSFFSRNNPISLDHHSVEQADKHHHPKQHHKSRLHQACRTIGHLKNAKRLQTARLLPSKRTSVILGTANSHHHTSSAMPRLSSSFSRFSTPRTVLSTELHSKGAIPSPFTILATSHLWWTSRLSRGYFDPPPLASQRFTTVECGGRRQGGRGATLRPHPVRSFSCLGRVRVDRSRPFVQVWHWTSTSSREAGSKHVLQRDIVQLQTHKKLCWESRDGPLQLERTSYMLEPGDMRRTWGFEDEEKNTSGHASSLEQARSARKVVGVGRKDLVPGGRDGELGHCLVHDRTGAQGNHVAASSPRHGLSNRVVRCAETGIGNAPLEPGTSSCRRNPALATLTHHKTRETNRSLQSQRCKAPS
eukprot:scaffold320_cov335-Pavlova_lutheri.AAC.21